MWSPPPTPTPGEPPDDPFGGIAETNLYWWRYEVAESLGMCHDHCCEFANAKVGIEELRRLARAGCPVELLARILV